MKRILLALVLLLPNTAWATTYAIPNGTGGYLYLDSATSETFEIGALSFPPPWLSTATDEQRAALGILAVVETPQPNSAQNTCAGSQIEIENGVPTVVWNCTPIPAPTQQQLAAAQLQTALNGGLQIVSTSTPALNGTYLLDSQNQSDATSVALYIQAFGSFPSGLTTFPWPDKNGVIHQIPSTTVALSFFRAIADYTAALDIAYNQVAAGQQATWPTQPITIP